MKTYIGVKMVQAEPMALGEFRLVKSGENPSAEGYKVVYPDGYESWSPKAIFDAGYYAISGKDSLVRQDVLDFAASKEFRCSKIGMKTAVAQVRCLTGFEITECSACVSEANYDQAKGVEVAVERIEDKLWGHLGFVLQWVLNGLKR